MLNLVLGENPDLPGVSPGDQLVAGLVEERDQVGAELLAYVVERRVAGDQPWRLEDQDLGHERAEARRGQKRAVELADTHLADHRHLVAGDPAIVHLEVHLPVGDLFELLA